MVVLPYIVIQSLMRRSLMGALATDPVLPERHRARRRPTRARVAPAVARTLATVRQS